MVQLMNWKMSVGADGIDVEEVGHAELAEAEFEAAARKFVEEREESALVLDFIFAEREDFVESCRGRDRAPC